MERIIRLAKKCWNLVKAWFLQIKTHLDKKNIDKHDLLWIIKNNGELGVSEVVFGKLLVRFFPSTTSKDTLTQPQVENPDPITPKHTQMKEDLDFAVATLGIDDPSEFMAKLETGEMEFAEINDSSTGEEI